MATRLEQSTKRARTMGLGCIGISVGIIAFNFISGFISPDRPEVVNPWPQTASNLFGQLPEVELNSLEVINSTSIEYRIETIDGKLPQLNPSPVIYVYKTETPHQSLTAQDDAEFIARTLKFKTKAQAISQTELKWVQGAKSLNINKLYNTVHLTTDYAKDPTAQVNYSLTPDITAYINAAQKYLDDAGLFPVEYLTATNRVTFLKLNNNKNLRSAKSASDANFVRVDFIKQLERIEPVITERVYEQLTEGQIEQLEQDRQYSSLVTDNPNEGQISIIIGGKGGIQTIYELSYIDWEIDTTSTYPLLPIESAWESVKQNNGHLRHLLKSGGDAYEPYIPLDVSSLYLTDVKLAYLSSDEYTKYFQPFYLFSGVAKLGNTDDQAEFVIYYPAVAQ